LNLNFQNFYKKFPYLDIQECIEYFSIFDGHPFIDKIVFSNNLNQAIQQEIIDKIDLLKKYFIYSVDSKEQILIQKILTRVSKGDRKNYTIYNKEKISQIKGGELFGYLFKQNIITKEKSREKPLKRTKKQPLKKALRRYKIQDKIHINSNFTRFWFTFISPSLEADKEISIASIEPFLEKYISLEFEKLSNQLLLKKFEFEKILSYGSYWDIDVEIDLLLKTTNQTIVGEAKWRNSKICKNILNSLQNKCKIADLNADRFALFSKSGFSKELKSAKISNIDLYELNDFKVLFS